MESALALGGTYTTGTITVVAGASTASFSGTLLASVAEQGDWILADGAIGFVGSVDSDTAITFEQPWAGASLTDAAYVLIKMSWLRYDPAITQDKVRQLIALLHAQGSFLFVTGSAPDPAMGEDGQYALKTNGGPWQLWYKTGGVWTSQGIPVGTTFRGEWDVATAYFANDQVGYQGSTWGAIVGSTGVTPGTDATKWSLSAQKGADGQHGGAVSFTQVFSTSTANADPGNGMLRLNNATQSLATVIRTDYLDKDGNALNDLIGSTVTGTSTVKGQIRLAEIGDPTRWIVFNLTGLSDMTGYFNLTVSHIAHSANPLRDAQEIGFYFTPKGDKGDIGPTGLGYGGTSATSIAIGGGSQVFTTQAGLAYQVGARVRVSSAASGSNYMEGLVSAYSGTSLTVNVVKTSGSGTFADWNINVAGDPGSGDMLSTNNLSELANKATSRTNLGATTVGEAVFTAADSAAARTALEIQPGMSDIERQRWCLTEGYLSKSLALYRASVAFIATGFKSATDTDRGINAGASSNYDTTNSNSFGFIAPTITSTTALASQTLNGDSNSWGGFTIRQWINASQISGSGSNIRLTLSPPSTGNSTVIAAMYVGHAAASGDAYDFDGNQAQVTVGGSGGFTLTAGGADVVTDAIPFAYDETKHLVISWVITSGDIRRNVSIGGGTMVTYYRGATSEAGTTNATTGYSTSATSTALTTVKKIEVGIVASDMTLVTVSQTTDSSVSNGRVLIEFDNTAAPTLNTDLTVEVTCDGGSNWAAATLSSVTAFSQGGRSVAETADTTCASGTSFAARIKTLNGKSVPIYCAAINVH